MIPVYYTVSQAPAYYFESHELPGIIITPRACARGKAIGLSVIVVVVVVRIKSLVQEIWASVCAVTTTNW